MHTKKKKKSEQKNCVFNGVRTQGNRVAQPPTTELLTLGLFES
jgi:hypothetical protein